MGLTDYGLLLILIIVQTVVGAFGTYIGYSVNGVQITTTEESSPGILGIIEWVWESIQFMFNMIAFQIDGMPHFISLIFIVMAIMTIYLIVKLIRGS